MLNKNFKLFIFSHFWEKIYTDDKLILQSIEITTGAAWFHEISESCQSIELYVSWPKVFWSIQRVSKWSLEFPFITFRLFLMCMVVATPFFLLLISACLVQVAFVLNVYYFGWYVKLGVWCEIRPSFIPPLGYWMVCLCIVLGTM